MRCVHPQRVHSILFELYEWSCWSHTGGKSLGHQTQSQSYSWPYMQKDALAYTKKCDKCKKYSPIIYRPRTELHLLTNPWPFAQWRLYIPTPFPKASGSRKFLLMATEYFIKWVEVVPLIIIYDYNVKTFLWENIVTWFGIPKMLAYVDTPICDSRKILIFSRDEHCAWSPELVRR